MSVIPYNTDTISNEIHTEWAGKTVHFAKEIDSTNEWCKRLSKEDAVHGTLAVAEFQSAGKGRLGRRWVVPEGNSIMMSILLRPDFEPRFASMLTLVMGLSVAQAVKELGVDVSIKWPNDVVVSRKKICGILTEMGLEDGKIREVVIGVGAAFQTEITKTMSGIPLEEVLRNICAGIEEEGMTSRVVKVLDTSDVGFMGLEAAKLSGSGIGIGLQSKGTTVIHQKDLYPLSNLELFPQAPLMDLDTYRKIGRNAAKYVKGEKVTPIECTNDPMVRAKYQVKAALLHIIETEQLDPEKGMIEWEGTK